VFVNCEHPSESTPISDPSYVGSFTFFGSPGAHAAAHGGRNPDIVLNATSAFRHLYGDIQIPANKSIRVSLVTRDLSKKAAEVVETVKPENVSLEVVSLTS
jgi:hypothetical protein